MVLILIHIVQIIIQLFLLVFIILFIQITSHYNFTSSISNGDRSTPQRHVELFNSCSLILSTFQHPLRIFPNCAICEEFLPDLLILLFDFVVLKTN